MYIHIQQLYFSKQPGLLSTTCRYKELCFSITDCRFLTNSAEHGSGLFLIFLDRTSQNSISIQNCEFIGNGRHHQSLSGGGAHIESYVYDEQLPSGNYIANWQGNRFCENSAHVGGGLFVSSLVYSFGECTGCGIHSTSFTNNTAVYGSALALYSYSQLQSYSKFILSSCVFESNGILHLSNIGLTGLGTVYIYRSNIYFGETASFNSNSGSALVMINSVANFSSSHVIFTNNGATTKGGAIRLLGSSYMQIDQNTEMEFDSNSAYYQGGAIYKQYLEQSSEHWHVNCFIRSGSLLQNPDEWKANFRFTGNTISGKPNAIHTTSVCPCLVKGINGGNPLCWYGWSYDNDSCSDTATVMRHISTGFSQGQTDSTITAVPSWPFSIDVKMQDYFENDIKTNADGYVAVVNDTDQVTAGNLNMITVKGETNETVLLLLEAISDSPAHIKLIVHLQDCPPGFVMIDENCTCPNKTVTYVTCDLSHKTAVIMDNYWMGQIDGAGDYYLTYCPTHLCEKKNSGFHIIPNSPSTLSDSICTAGREGVLCGECKEGFCLSVHSYSYNCINATDINLYSSIATYISTVYLPYGCILVALALFNFKVTDGSLNGLVLFAQMITTTFDLTEHNTIPLSKSSSFFPKTYRFIYGVFNLDFIEKHINKFCFSSQLNILSVLLLDYLLFILPVVSVIAIAVIVETTRRCIRKDKLPKLVNKVLHEGEKGIDCTAYFGGLSKTLGEAVILVLSSIAVLSYTKLSTTSAQLLHVKTLSKYDTSSSNQSRVSVAGQLSSKDSAYIYYQVPAVLGEIYLVIFVLLLLDYPLRIVGCIVQKVHFLNAIYPAQNISHFVDEFQSCFRPKFKFFAGIYYIFRLTTSLIFITGYSSIQGYLILELACISIVLLLVIFRPYKRNSQNFSDVFIFANLAIINALNFYQNSYLQMGMSKNANNLVFAVQYILAMIPVLCFSIVTATKLIKAHKRTNMYVRKIIFKFMHNQNVVQLDRNYNDDRNVGDRSCDSVKDSPTISSLSSRSSQVKEVELRVEEGVRNPNIPVTVIDVDSGKDMGEANTIQTSVSRSEGYYLKTEWNSGRDSYGAI